MDLTKAQYLLLKIQTFLEMGNGHELSRLEKDLMKSYIRQLYDAVSEDELSSVGKTFNQMEAEPVRETIEPEIVAPKKVSPPPVAPIIVDNSSANRHEPAVKEEAPAPQASYAAPEPEVIIEQKATSAQATKEVPLTPPVESSSVEPKGGASEDLLRLFELSHPKEMDSRFSHVPIDDIASALGLNERIFTLNVLFGGDTDLFDSTCAKLNNLNSFSEATGILLNGPALKYNWADRESVKMAEHFIRTLARRYPHT